MAWTPVGSIRLCSWKEIHVYVDPCVWPSLWYYLGKAGAQAQPITRRPSCYTGLLGVFIPQPTAHISLYFLNARFPYSIPVLVQAQESPAGGGSSEWSSPSALWRRLESSKRGRTQLSSIFCENQNVSCVCFSATAFLLACRRGTMLLKHWFLIGGSLRHIFRCGNTM